MRYLLALVLCLGLGSFAVAADQPVFRAGAAMSNITPFIGDLIVGNFNPAPSKHVHDELHAKCIVLDDGTTRIGIVVCDLIALTRDVLDEAKRLAEKSTGIPVDRILISATHTHSASSARSPNSLKLEPELTEYQKFVAHRIADGLLRAQNNLEPARIGWGAGSVPGQVFNRRWYMKPGPHLTSPYGDIDQVRMNPPTGDLLLEPAGPTDPQVSFISIQSKEGRPIALLANYSLHYVGNTGSGAISADYFAVFGDRIQQLLGADRLDPPFVGIMSNGTSGDINNVNFRAGRERRQPFEKIRIVADELAQEVYRVHQTIKFHDWVSLGMETRELELASRRPTPEQLEFAKKILAGELDPPHTLSPNYARRALDLHDSPEKISIVLQAIRIGDLGIAAIPFEVFAEIGLELKERSPLKPMFTIELANGGYGYLPTPEQHRLGGYETWLGTNRVEIEASRKIVNTLLPMLQTLADTKQK